MTVVQDLFKNLNQEPDQLLEVLKHHGGLKVSVLLPIATEPPQSDQNVVILKELYQTALDKVIENGVEEGQAHKILDPIEKLIEDPKSLLQPASALAFLIDETGAYMVQIPYEVESHVTVGNRFVLKPMLPLLQQDTAYSVICLNREGTKLYKGTRLGIWEVDVPDMPSTLNDVTKFDDPEKSVQHHTSKTSSDKGAPGSSPVATVHGQGMPSEIESEQHERFFHEVANAVKKFLANDHSPLIVIGVDENLGLFKSSIDWGDQEIFSIHHDPSDWSTVEILSHANETLEPQWAKRISDKLNRLEEAYNKDTGVFDTGKCALAAANARVEMVCVASDKSEPGLCEPENMKVEFVESDDAGCAHDLLDTIAYEAIQHGGEAFTLPAEKIPGPGNTAATVRYET